MIRFSVTTTLISDLRFFTVSTRISRQATMTQTVSTLSRKTVVQFAVFRFVTVPVRRGRQVELCADFVCMAK
jgi:hypothetical protein